MVVSVHTGKGWASVLNTYLTETSNYYHTNAGLETTYLSRGMRSPGLNSKYRYFSVSAKKND